MVTFVARLLSAIALIISFYLISGCDSGGSTGPGTGPNGDDLVLSQCEVVEIDNMMHVRWTANRATQGTFRYGQSALVQMTNDPDFEVEHEIILVGLVFDVNYIYRLTVNDQLGNTAECEGDFRTPVKATPEPYISNLQVTDITEEQATVSWITDELATTILYYGEGNTGDSIVISSFDFEHEVTLNGLNSATDYSIRPEAVDLDGLRGIGTETSFTTATLLRLWFDDKTIAVGETSDVAIHLEGAVDLGALQYRLQFEDTLNTHSGNGAVKILDLRYGPFTAPDIAPLFFQEIRNSQRYVENEMAWTMYYNGNTRIGTAANGGGTIAILTIRGIKAGALPSEFDEDVTFGLDMFSVQRACSLRTGIITVTQ
ncbi:fibronectin type III domain-containing protein [bacterium]|nr:MAG: fibronectin type III domain-containing protein [bacterium]